MPADRTSLIPLVALAAGCALLLVACGSSRATTQTKPVSGEAAKPAQQILKDAQHVASLAISVHATGHGVEAGQNLTLDISISSAGADAKFTLFGGHVELLQIGPRLYLNGDRAFWQHFGGNGLRLSVVADHWVVAPVSSQTFSAFTGLMTMAGFTSRLAVHGKVVNEGVKTFDGQQAIALRDNAENGTVYVSATGKPYPIALVGGKTSVTLTFDHWNGNVPIPPPPKHALGILGG